MYGKTAHGAALAAALVLVACTVADVTRPHSPGDAADPTARTAPWQSPPSPYGSSTTAAAAASSAPAGTVYVCPMHADVVRDAPGVCPKCGMTLMPHAPAAAPASHGGH